jgi:hypothetical protein
MQELILIFGAEESKSPGRVDGFEQDEVGGEGDKGSEVSHCLLAA